MPGKRLDGQTRVDVHVGSRIRSRRLQLKMSQTQVGERINVTHQQVQKYEGGKASVSIAKLARIAEALDATIAFFVDGLEAAIPQETDKGVIERFSVIEGASDIAQWYETMPPDARDIYKKTGELLANIPWQREP